MRPSWPRHESRRYRAGSFALLLGLCLGLAQPAGAASPTATLEAFFARANSVLQSADPAQGLEAPRQAIRDLTNEVFDFREAARAALGPAWASRVPEEQEAFTRLFASLLERGFVATIGSKARVIGGVSIRYLGESIDGESASVATALMTRGGEELPVEYWMVRRGDRWKVKDVVVDGVSLVMNYRAQFARILSTAPYAELVARMRPETPSEPPPAVLAPAAASIQVSSAVVARPPAERSVMQAAAQVRLPAQPSQKIKARGAKQAAPAGAEASSPVSPAATPAPSGGSERRGDVVGRLAVKNRSKAEREVASLLTRTGGAAVSRQRGPAVTVVTGVLPGARYDAFATGLRAIGAWQVETERAPRPDLLHVTVRLAE
jgi:phospholipid transport system substrate-binding protein